ncbi:MAG: PQQ-binding-like beta-propeller repeat protein [Polyangiaceae bacterium]|nr:PQQ-binding-like beta-propeller repeat protein [Polyangiaceae bacterium]
MSALHVVVQTRPDSNSSNHSNALTGLLDLIVDGVNITARLRDGQSLATLAELARAVAALNLGRRERAVLQLYTADDVWELGFEPDGDQTRLSLFRCGSVPDVAVFERCVASVDLHSGILAALDDALQSEAVKGSTRRALASARITLAGAPAISHPKRRSVALQADGSAGSFRIRANAEFRKSELSFGSTQVERSDLHSLLIEGTLTLGNEHPLRLERTQLFLLAERLLDLTREVLDSWQAARPLFRRVTTPNARFALRFTAADNQIELKVANLNTYPKQPLFFLELSCPDFVGAVVDFVETLADAYVKADPSQIQNLRLRGLVNEAQFVKAQRQQTATDDSVTNPEPESYREFFPPRGRRKEGAWSQGGSMRFTPRWVATIPGLDLKATFLCGDRLVVGSSRETACIDRDSGAVLWRNRCAPAGCVVTPAGLVRIHADGQLISHDLDTGEPRFTLGLTPCMAGGTTGAVVHSPGLPRLLIVTEGDRRITAVDLVSGDVRWRYTGNVPTAYRVKRAGKLLLVSSGDSALLALDVCTGEIVWRLRARLPFTGDISVEHDSAFALSGANGGNWTLHHLDPWTGKQRWEVALEERAVPGQSPVVTPEAVVIPTCDTSGVGARAYDRVTGKLLWEHVPGLASTTASWLAVDDVIVINTDAGLLLALDAKTGQFRFNHVFSRNREADQPRRLAPVLRNGALFVPQHEVHVVRPRDGELLGTVPTDLIPDLLRVDERCSVYVAEESGHLAAFAVAPKLSLVL